MHLSITLNRLWRIMLVVTILFRLPLESNATNSHSLDSCIASFTIELDTAESLPVYVFTADQDDPAYSYIWNVGGALQRATDFQLRHIFFDGGTWDITLTVQSASDTCTFMQRVTPVTPDPEACFFNFWKTDESTLAVETWLPFFWPDQSYTLNFGDGTVIENDPQFGVPLTHTYDAPGAYTICQTTTQDACTYCQEVVIALPDTTQCDASYSYKVDSLNSQQYTFTPGVIDSASQYLWEIEGGFQSSDVTLTYTFPDSGVWKVDLHVFTDTDSCTTTQQIHVTQRTDTLTCPTSFVYHPVDSTNDLRYLFTPLVIDSQKSFLWKIEGLVESTEILLDYTFPSTGIWTVDLFVFEDSSVCKTSQEIVIDPTGCNAAFAFEVDSLNSQQYTFTPSIIDSARQYLWAIEGGFQSSDVPLTYAFPDGGLWTVALEVITPSDTCSTSQTVFVAQNDTTACNASFSFEIDSLDSYKYTFIPQSDSAMSYEWFVDGVLASEDASFHYTFPDSGWYAIGLEILSDQDTCSSFQNLLVESKNDSSKADSLYIKGKLFADLVPIDGVLKLYKKERDKWERHAKVLSENGEYEFTGLGAGEYLIHARGKKELHEPFIPTYFVNGVGWRDAFILDVASPVEGINITLIKSIRLSRQGQGVLNGKLISMEEGEREEVILLKEQTSNSVLKWTITEADHGFSFDELPFGDYQITLERPSGAVSRSFSLTEEQPVVNLDMDASDVVTGLDDPFESDLNVIVYPSYFEGKIFIENTSHSRERLTLILRSINGQLLLAERVELGPGEQHIQMVDDTSPGMKFLTIQNAKGAHKVIRLIKE